MHTTVHDCIEFACSFWKDFNPLHNLPSLFCLFLEDVDVFELFWPSGSEVWLKLEESEAGCKKSFADPVVAALLLLLVLLLPVKVNYSKKPNFFESISSNSKFPPNLFRMSFLLPIITFSVQKVKCTFFGGKIQMFLK